MESKQVTIFLCIDSKTANIPYTDKINCEQIVIHVCKQLGIGPLARHLFSLRIFNTKIWLPLNGEIINDVKYEFRIRYKVASLQRLKKNDIKAYDYYFQQARYDVRNYMIEDIIYDNVKRELLGLGVADMYRVMIEKDLSVDAVLNDYKKFISKEVIKHHKFFIKKPVRDSLTEIIKRGHDAWFVKGEYLKQFDLMAPEYLTEEYNALMDRDGAPCRVILRVSPYNKDFSGIRVCYDSHRKEWEQISAIEDLCFISISEDGTVQISRKNGIPTYLKFESFQIMHSFISLLDGYYRLMVKWTFNLCKEMLTPTLKRLHELKCHGPVGGEFSYAKLEEKKQNRRGCYILRESEIKYNVYYIDVCTKTGVKPKTYKLEKMNDEEYIFNDDVTRYKSISELRKAYNKPDSSIYLNECLPPSEYDKSPLLLCLPENMYTEALTDSDAVTAISAYPIVIQPSNLQIYKGQMKESANGVIVVYRSMWRLAKGKKIEVALKVLRAKENEGSYLKEFMQRAGQWAGLREGAKGIVRLWGISLSLPTALVLEYAKLGPLSQYLTECRNGDRESLESGDLLEAASHLASALYHLEEHHLVHGKIRCSKLLVFSHDENSFVVKLADSGIHTPYVREDIHWLPIECYSNFELACKSHMADVWAFATTVWEIYMLGEQKFFDDNVDAMELYVSGVRLRQPAKCPDYIFKILLECWHKDPHHRKKPQAIMRDINQLLLVFNSRRKRPYATLFTKNFSETSSLASVYTENTVLSQRDELLSFDEVSIMENKLSIGSELSDSSFASSSQWSNLQDLGNNELVSSSCETLFSNLVCTNSSSNDGIGTIQTIFELDSNLQLIKQRKIGSGFYGEVFLGDLGTNGGELRPVAVKQLKAEHLSSNTIADFEREISIMRKLQHPNIVQILTSLEAENYLIIMEYLPHGSLQSYLKIYRESITNKQLMHYALGIARGMAYLAQQHIVHRDLAARNVLVVDENHVKISDFGLAQFVGKNEYYILRTNRDLPIKWYAPESLRDGKFSIRSDVWSYGVTLFEMFSFGEEPNLRNLKEDEQGQQLQQNILDALQTGLRLPCPANCPQSVYARIMYSCWNIVPNERPTFAELSAGIQDLLNTMGE